MPLLFVTEFRKPVPICPVLVCYHIHEGAFAASSNAMRVEPQRRFGGLCCGSPINNCYVEIMFILRTDTQGW